MQLNRSPFRSLLLSSRASTRRGKCSSSGAATALAAAARPSVLCRGALTAVVAIAIAGAVPAQWQQAKLTAAVSSADDWFGTSVSMSSDTALVGAIFGDGASMHSGSVHVIVRDAFGTWSQEAKLTAADGAPYDHFGLSVSLSGDTALIGASGDDEVGTSSGSAYVFVRDADGTWAEQAKLTASDAAPFNGFGISVSLSGDTALVGTHSSAYVFVRDDVGSWTPEAKLAAPEVDPFDRFGWSVSMHGDTALVGAYGDGDDGAAYAFVRDAMGNWTQEAKLKAADGAFGDLFGISVSLRGDTALVGASGDGAGSAYVFVRDGNGDWTEQAKLTAPDAAPHDSFGISVSLRGDTALVGAYNDDDAGVNSGSAYAFTRDTKGNWVPHAKLTASDGTTDDLFGTSVSLSGDTALVGAYKDDDASVDSGSVYVMCLGKLTAPDAAPYDYFGQSVSISGDTALVGAYLDGGAGNGSGSAYVFARVRGGNWARQVKLTASDGAQGDTFGFAVAAGADTALVGASGDDGAGSAYVFVRDGNGNWVQQGKLTASDRAGGDLFGAAVSLSGDTALVGALRDDEAGVDSGSAYVFVRDGNGSWTQQAKLTPSDGTADDFFGISVSLSGNTALVGASGVDGFTGSAYVFVADGAGSWTQQARLSVSDARWSEFGKSVSLSGEMALIGAPGDDLQTGAAYAFARDATGSWTQQARLRAADGTNHDFFGTSVALSGNAALIGARGDDDAGVDSGSAYRFRRHASGLWRQEAKLTGDAAAGDGFGSAVSLDGNTALVGAPLGDADDTGAAYVFCGSPGAFASFGGGCAGRVGVPILSAYPGQVASIGETFWLDISGMPGDAANTPFAIIGLSKTRWGQLSLPLDLGQFGAPGCRLQVSIDAIGARVNDGGTAAWRLRIPDNPAFVGMTIYVQAAVVDFGANAANLIMTNAGALEIVDR